ncbi:MAG: DUF2156 domain-containing protein [Syntrophorhabdales bacterium]|nr:DUF2156 domain-containing protein [Syntrophorhabdales bacterium]
MKNIFPNFKNIELRDINLFKDFFTDYNPQTSEWTFTNLFMWRNYYSFQWSIHKDWLLIICLHSNGMCCAFQPLGPPSRKEVTILLLEWLRDEKRLSKPAITRADSRLAREIKGINLLSINPEREHFDYVYLRDNLVRLSGNKYSAKRNHINKLLKRYNVRYDSLKATNIEGCIRLQEKWCRQKRCDEDMSLMGEWEAIKEVLIHYEALDLTGGVASIDNEVMAFTIGEMLNHNTAVIHIEKADSDIPGLYPFINQRFSEYGFPDATYINREQDLGLPGLRDAKLSYYPDHLVEKFSVTLES